jgi:integrase/recombinase XerD
MPYQYVREPLTADESDRLSNACETPTERFVVWSHRIPRINGP